MQTQAILPLQGTDLDRLRLKPASRIAVIGAGIAGLSSAWLLACLLYTSDAADE